MCLLCYRILFVIFKSKQLHDKLNKIKLFNYISSIYIKIT